MKYQPHPLALIVPPMSPDEFRDLKADIKAHGLEQPITLLEGKILDGIHRNRACVELGIEVEVREWRKRNGQTPVQYVLSMNGHRRHLSPGQKACLAVDLAVEMRRQFPATAPGGGERGDVQSIATALGVKLRPAQEAEPKVIGVAAAAVGASESTAEEVLTLKYEAPKLYEKVRDGLMTISRATKERKAAQPKPRKSAAEINEGLIRQLEGQLKAAADTVAKLEARDVELSGNYLLTIWGYAFTVAATIKNVAKQPNLPETKAGAQRLLSKATNGN